MNKGLEENVKKLEEENNMLKKELSTLKQEKECLNVKPVVCDVSYDTNNLEEELMKVKKKNVRLLRINERKKM